MSLEATSFDRVGPYTLLHLAREGGMGRIDVALAPDGGETLCVLKRIKHGPRTHEHQKRFLREARLAQRLSHRAIARTVSVELIDGELCILQEFIHGATVQQIESRAATDEPLPVPIAVFIGIEVARALGCAHAANIVHRDVAPDNVMVSFDGQVKLIDFGIAKWLDGDETALTEVGRVLGRPAYTAPEIQRGGTPSALGDIYALGVVLWQLSTGRLLPEDGRDTPPRPSDINAAVGPSMDAVVLRALAPNPADRYQSANDIADDLLTLIPASPEGERVLREFLALHFPVELERKMLAEDVQRARRQMNVAPVVTSDNAASESTLVVVRRGPRRPAVWIASGLIASAVVCGVAISRLASESPARRDPLTRPATSATSRPPDRTIASSSHDAVKARERISETQAASMPPNTMRPTENEEPSSRPHVPRRRPNRSAALISTAQERLASGDLLAAYAAARRAVRDGGGEPAHLVLGYVLQRQGRHALAAQEFAHVLKLNPSNHEADRQLKRIRQAEGR